jgi:hypothetical protein
LIELDRALMALQMSNEASPSFHPGPMSPMIAGKKHPLMHHHTVVPRTRVKTALRPGDDGRNDDKWINRPDEEAVLF